MAEATFARLWLDPSISISEIAATLGVCRQAVTIRAKVRGLPPRSLVAPPLRDRLEDRAPELADLWRANVGLQDMAAHFECSHTAIIKAAERLGLPKRSRSRWHKISLDDYRALQLREAMARDAQKCWVQFKAAEMLDGRQDGRWPIGRAAA
jgi:hypothetical protein